MTVDVERYRQAFFEEAAEYLVDIEGGLLALEQSPGNSELLNSLFRRVHSVKGGAYTFDLPHVAELSHLLESLLDQMRAGTVSVTGDRVELMLRASDCLRAVLKATQTDGDIPAEREGVLAELKHSVQIPDECSGVNSSLVASERAACEPRNALGGAAAVAQGPGQGVNEASANHASLAASPASQWVQETGDTVRVDRSKLDALIDMIGELVIGEAMVRQEFRNSHNSNDSESLIQLARTVRDLQETSLALRMVPIGGTFQKMARVVRDVARKLGKQVHFETHGEDTELDKTIVDQLGAPLMHMVRNAADHAIESPAERVAAGKPAEGRVALRAFLRSGSFYIEMEDDGRGLNREAILRKAVEQDVVGVSQCDQLRDEDVWQLVFAPGFTTASAVTDVSGRGVGMDVVKRSVESLNGSIDINSSPGRGSTFRIRLPLTMAIVDGLSVSLSGEVFILPLVSVIESLRPLRSDIKTVSGRGEMLQVRDKTIPLIRLHRLFNRPAGKTDPSQALVVIVESQGQQLALLVDELQGQVQAVMKSLEANYQKVVGIAGATILGNGEVAFIVDVAELAKMRLSWTEPRAAQDIP